MQLRVILDNTIHISRNTFEYNSTLYKGLLLEDITISKDLDSGFLETNWGELEVSLVAFKGNDSILYKNLIDITIYYGDLVVFIGVGEKALGTNSIIYTLYTDLPFTDNLLLEQDDINGNTITRPEAFGTVDHYKPVLYDDTNFTYLVPTHLTINDIADDGVWGVEYTNNDDGTITLDNAPVGVISINVTSSYKTVAEVLQYLTGFTIDTVNIYNDTLNMVVDSQITKVELVKKILNYTSNIAYIGYNNSLRVVKYDYTDYTIKLDNNNHKVVKDSLSANMYTSFKEIKASWKTYKGVLESNILQLKEYEHEITITGGNTYAQALTFDVLETNSTDNEDLEAQIRVKLDRYITRLQRMEISVDTINILNIDTPSKVLVDTSSMYGDMVITGITHNIGKQLTTTFRGFGNVYFKEV